MTDQRDDEREGLVRRLRERHAASIANRTAGRQSFYKMEDGLLDSEAADFLSRQPSAEDAELVAFLKDSGEGWGRDSYNGKMLHKAASRLSALSGQKVEVSEAEQDAETLAKFVGHDCIANGEAWNERARAIQRTRERKRLRDALKGEK